MNYKMGFILAEYISRYTTAGVVSSVYTFEMLNADWPARYRRGLTYLISHMISMSSPTTRQSYRT